MDKVTLDRIEFIHPKLKDELKLIYAEICAALTGKAMCRFAYTLRSFAEQDALFHAVPQVTKAKGGQSYHNYGLAVDIVLVVDKDGNGSYETASWDTKSDFDGDGKSDWQEVVAIFKRYGWEWGGNWASFPDMPHFQKTLGYTIVQLQALHAKQLANGKTGYLAL
jgi:peptidoglycan L-alanyl-D-glutamate endopeptidase CwlK